VPEADDFIHIQCSSDAARFDGFSVDVNRDRVLGEDAAWLPLAEDAHWDCDRRARLSSLADYARAPPRIRILLEIQVLSQISLR